MENEINIIERGDSNVGINATVVATVCIQEDYATALKEDGKLGSFCEDFRALVDKYFDTEYSTYFTTNIEKQLQR